MKLLIIDNDRHMVEMMTGWLKVLGYEVNRAYTEEQARIKWKECKADVVIVDTHLGDTDALMLCQELRNQNDALILVLTEDKGVRDEIRCLEAGADGYMHKPFFPDQLLAHIHAISRRARSSVRNLPPPLVQVGSLCIDSLYNEVHIRGKTIRLTPTECKLIHLLAINAGNVCTLDQIVNYVWDFAEAGINGLVRSHIYHLRRKIEMDTQDPHYILTVPNIGYMLVRRDSA